MPYKIHPVLTDNGIQFAKREGTEAYWAIPFDRLCDALGIEHRLTKVNHPWTMVRLTHEPEQLRQTPQNPQRFDALSTHLQNMDE